MYYFAYGSNMDSKRMVKRGVEFFERKRGILHGFKLAFNKISSNNPQEGFANIVECKNSAVEGIIYKINQQSLNKLDMYEGYPEHYIRNIVDIETDSDTVEAIVYAANPKKIDENLLPKEEYLNYLLGGCDYLSDGYCKMLRNIKTLNRTLQKA